MDATARRLVRRAVAFLHVAALRPPGARERTPPLQSLMLEPPARRRTAELMDDPSIPVDAHEHALRGLARINRLSSVGATLWRAIERSLGAPLPTTLTLLDVASGSGDLPVELATIARARGCTLSAIATDISDVALDVAARRATARGVPLATQRHDILASDLPRRADIVTCSLFMHHLDPEQVVTALSRLSRAATRLALVLDLRRTRRGLALAWAAPRLLTTSRVVHVDAVRSVQGSYTISELRDLAAAAGLATADVRAAWPQRMLLTWKPFA